MLAQKGALIDKPLNRDLVERVIDGAFKGASSSNILKYFYSEYAKHISIQYSTYFFPRNNLIYSIHLVDRPLPNEGGGRYVIQMHRIALHENTQRHRSYINFLFSHYMNLFRAVCLSSILTQRFSLCISTAYVFSMRSCLANDMGRVFSQLRFQ